MGKLKQWEVYRIIGLIYGCVGLLVTCMNAIYVVINDRDFIWLNYVYIVVGLFLVITSLTSRQEVPLRLFKRNYTLDLMRLNTLVQFYVMCLICVAAIFESHDGQYNLAMLLLAGLMGLKYRILNGFKLAILMVSYAVLFEVSARLSGLAMRGLYIALFGFFFYGIALIMYQEDLRKQFQETKKYRDRLISVQSLMKKYEGETVDLTSIHFTPREIDILRELCMSQGSNQELAGSLGIKEQTVKSHMRNIFDKAGVDDRHQLVDLFRLNFVGKV